MSTHRSQLTHEIIGAAMDVHRALGPGLLESAYQACLAQELTLRNISFEREVKLPLLYKGAKVDTSYRLDFLVVQQVVLELKAVEVLIPIHEVQLVTYLKIGNYPLGLLMNFNVPLMKDGIRRKINSSAQRG